jgi:hypothetical protein
VCAPDFGSTAALGSTLALIATLTTRMPLVVAALPRIFTSDLLFVR